MDFKCTYSALNLNGFTHTLLIVSSNTVIWYLTFRYLVVSLQLLPNQFEGSFYDGNRNLFITQQRLSMQEPELSGQKRLIAIVLSLSPEIWLKAQLVSLLSLE